MKDDEHTPPRGGAKRNSEYRHLDDRALIERMADKATQAYIIARRVEGRIDLVLAGYRPWWERLATPAIAVVLLVWFMVWTTRASTSVPEPQGVSAHR